MNKSGVKTSSAWALFGALVLVAFNCGATDGDGTKGLTCSAASSATQCGRSERCVDRPQEMPFQGSVVMPARLRKAPEAASCEAHPLAGLSAFDCTRDGGKRCVFELTGEIKVETSLAFEKYLREAASKGNRGQFTMYLNSTGGDMESAMQIGAILRERQATVVVREGAICASACVFIYAGAVNRVTEGSIVIHRPYRSQSVVLGAQEAQRQYGIRNTKIREFLQSMNIAPSFLEAMNAIPPEDMRTLAVEEMNMYGLFSADPVYQEELDASEAKRQGLTMNAYLGKKKKYRMCTQAIPQDNLSETALGNCLRLLN